MRISKRVGVIVAAATLAGALVACASPSGSDASATGKAGDTPAAGPVMREWTFADGSGDGWRNGWNSSEDSAVSDVDFDPALGMVLTMSFQSSAWGDGNVKVAWNEEVAPATISMRLLVPAAGSKPRGMQLGCAMNMPWTEAKHWPELKFPDHVKIGNTEYLAQDVTCRLGTSAKAPSPKEIVLRFGGDRVRYKGPIYVQKIRVLR